VTQYWFCRCCNFTAHLCLYVCVRFDYWIISRGKWSPSFLICRHLTALPLYVATSCFIQSLMLSFHAHIHGLVSRLFTYSAFSPHFNCVCVSSTPDFVSLCHRGSVCADTYSSHWWHREWNLVKIAPVLQKKSHHTCQSPCLGKCLMLKGIFLQCVSTATIEQPSHFLLECHTVCNMYLIGGKAVLAQLFVFFENNLLSS